MSEIIEESLDLVVLFIMILVGLLVLLGIVLAFPGALDPYAETKAAHQRCVEEEYFTFEQCFELLLKED